MNQTHISVVIPAHNEAGYILPCLRAIRHAARNVPDCTVETIVVANRCTDQTAHIAARRGARVILNEDKCISSVRNAGIRAAKGDIIVTIDADSRMTPGSLQEICARLATGREIGGGAVPEFDRMSLGIAASSLYVALQILPHAIRSGGMLSGAMFWFRKADFEAIGGFDTHLVSLEDMDFAKRLKALGESRGQKYGTLRENKVITSSRKFDTFGDWYLIRNRKLTKALFTGTDRAAADQFYYDVR